MENQCLARLSYILERSGSGVCFKGSINVSVFYRLSPHGFIRTRLVVHFSNGFWVYLHGCALGQCGWPVSHPNAVSHNECISKLNEILFFFHYFLLHILPYWFACSAPWTWPHSCCSMSIILSSSARPQWREISIDAFSREDSQDSTIHTRFGTVREKLLVSTRKYP